MRIRASIVAITQGHFLGETPDSSGPPALQPCTPERPEVFTNQPLRRHQQTVAPPVPPVPAPAPAPPPAPAVPTARALPAMPAAPPAPTVPIARALPTVPAAPTVPALPAAPTLPRALPAVPVPAPTQDMHDIGPGQPLRRPQDNARPLEPVALRRCIFPVGNRVGEVGGQRRSNRCLRPRHEAAPIPDRGVASRWRFGLPTGPSQ